MLKNLPSPRLILLRIRVGNLCSLGGWLFNNSFNNFTTSPSLFCQQLSVAESRKFSETDSMGTKCSAGPSRCDPKRGQREGAHELLASSVGASSGGVADFDGLESKIFVGAEFVPPGVAGASAASFVGMDDRLRDRWRAKRRAEAGSDFVAAFTVGETPFARWNRVNDILHESQFCCMTRTPQNSQTKIHRIHMRAPCMMCMLHDVFRIH